jgi:hypothetical protein
MMSIPWPLLALILAKIRHESLEIDENLMKLGSYESWRRW